jgi:hypothetical protein
MGLSLSRNLPGPRIFFLRRFLDLISKSVSSSRPASLRSMRAEAVKIGRRTNLAACFALARPYLDGFEHDGPLNAVAMTIRGEPAFGARFNRATTLYPVASWDSKTRWNNLLGDLAVNVTAGSSGRTNSPHPSSREGHHSTARWSSSVLIGLDAARFSCCCCGLFSGPAELGAVNPYAVHDYSQPACQGHDRLFHPAAPGDLHRPGLEPGPSCRTHQHSTAISPPQ